MRFGKSKKTGGGRPSGAARNRQPTLPNMPKRCTSHVAQPGSNHPDRNRVCVNCGRSF